MTRSIDIFALSLISDAANAGGPNGLNDRLPIADAVETITVGDVEPDLTAGAILGRLSVDGLIVLAGGALIITQAGLEALVLFDVQAVLVQAGFGVDL